MIRRSPLVSLAALLPIAFVVVACHKNDAAAPTDAGATDAGVAVVDAGPIVLAEPSNEASIGRFGDETKLADVAATIADPHANARNSVPGGALVASLRQGEAVVQIAQHDKFFLCTFPDPKDSTKRLEGWVADEAFKPGPTQPIPKTATCPNPQVHLMVDEQIFCGNICKEDKDCPGGQRCVGQASSYVEGHAGPSVTTCTVPAGGSAAPPANLQAGVQVAPIAPNACLTGYGYGTDKLCHRLCPHGNECPAPSRCVARDTTTGLAACQL